MTSRTTPVGIIVIALAGLFALGCNAQTSAVFEAFVDPASASASSSDAEATADATDEGGTQGMWWPHPDGYHMDLPTGWFGVPLERAQANRLINAVNASYPGLAERMRSVLGDTGSRVSAVAGDPIGGQSGPVMLVLAQPKDGKRAHEIKQHVKKQISQLPGLVATPILQDAAVDTRQAWRFDYSLADQDLGTLRVRSYLVRWGDEAYLVSFVAPEATADEADILFDAIVDSLKFGV